MDSSGTDEFEDDDTSPRTFGKRLVGLASGLGEALARTAASATVLLSDAQLRRQGASVLTAGASKGFRGVQSGVVAGVQRLQAGPKQLRAALIRVQQRIEEERLAVLLREQQDTPVDVQVGFQIYEDAPQELRSRLWMALLEHPAFVREHRLLRRRGRSESTADKTPERTEDLGAEQPGAAPAAEDLEEHAGLASAGLDLEDERQGRGQGYASLEAEGAAVQNQEIPEVEPKAADPELEEAADPELEEGRIPTLGGAEAELDAPGPTSLASSEAVDLESSLSAAGPPPFSPIASSSLGAGEAASEASPTTSGFGDERGGGSGEQEWEVVEDGKADGKLQGRALLECASLAPRWSLEREALRNSLMAAMMALPWPLPTDYPPDCRYATLLQISVGQEEVDEVISRDIHRTFPEYPLFGAEAGQKALFRVLKAYSLHDLEVGYCQGMAFVVGLVLFYVPEEPAFQIFCRLLSSAGPNLRRFYLPGLAGLKTELHRFDALMCRHLPALRQHLEAHGVVPVLYASQWFLTAFACPFPVSFACRVLDGLLAENDSSVLLRVALSLMAECEADLLLRDDFEDLLTFLKVDPLAWPAFRTRRVLDAAMNSPLVLHSEDDEHAAAGPSPPELTRTAWSSRQSPAPAAEAEAMVSQGPPADPVDAEVAKQRAEMDEDFLEMVLELDNLWTGDAVSAAANEAYDQHLGGAPGSHSA